MLNRLDDSRLLDREMPRGIDTMAGQDLRRSVDERLEALFPPGSPSDTLNQAIRHGVLAPGKRIRPLLTVLTGWELGRRDLSLLDAGCAVEMIHAASLILDDLPAMDDARLRRGRPATHVAFGEDVAILAAVSLIGKAFATLAACPGLTPEGRGRAVAILAGALGADGLSGGQYADLRGGDRDGAVQHILDTNHLKTGVLFVAAVELAAVLSGADDEGIRRLRHFARQLGQGFQLLDDLKDGGAGPSSEDAGKITVLTLLGQEDVRRRIGAHAHDGLSVLAPDGELATFARTLFGATVRVVPAVSIPHGSQ